MFWIILCTWVVVQKGHPHGLRLQKQWLMPSLHDIHWLSLNRCRHSSSGQKTFALKEPTDLWERCTKLLQFSTRNAEIWVCTERSRSMEQGPMQPERYRANALQGMKLELHRKQTRKTDSFIHRCPFTAKFLKLLGSTQREQRSVWV